MNSVENNIFGGRHPTSQKMFDTMFITIRPLVSVVVKAISGQALRVPGV
jgi:hypothetical protein